jgi:CRISPR-associated protein (TIGR03984 family)
MTDAIKSVKSITKRLDVPADTDVKAWLEAQISGADMPFYLLAHADDGVIWSKTDDSGKLVTAPQTDFSPPLRAETLHDARLFSTVGEVFLWRDGDGNFRARAIIDGGVDAQDSEYYDEEQILWGTRAEPIEQGFTLLREGAQGLCHVVPIQGTSSYKEHSLRLTVRHYLETDDKGLVRVKYSRLVNLYQYQKQSEGA